MAQIEKKGAEEAYDFSASMRKAEEEAGLTPGTDPAGRTQSEWDALQGEIPVEAEEAPEAEPTTEIVEPPAVETEEPVEAGLEEEPPEEAAVEAKADPDDDTKKKLGQILNDNADLRREVEALRQAQEQPQQVSLNETTVGWFDDLTAQNPLEAAYWALQNQQPILYDRAIRQAYEVDPIAAGRYERQIEAAAQEARLAAQIQPQIQDAQRMAQKNELDQALVAVAEKHDDFAQVVGTLDEARAKEIVEGGFPVQVLEGLAGNQESKERVFETLYRWVKAEQTGELVQAAQQTAGKTAEESRAAKVAATVASASTTTPEAVPETEEERFSRYLREETASMRKAWSGQESRRSGR